MHMNMETSNEVFANGNILFPVDFLSEVQDFFPIQKQSFTEKYASLAVKVREIDEGKKEIFYEGKKPFSRIVSIHDDYSREEVIFYTYLLLHVEYDWFPFDDKPKELEKSNLKEFCHDFFTKARDYTYKGDRDVFQTKRIFEMFLYCSIKNEVEYDLPPYEELWRVFLQEKHLMSTSYKLLFRHEENTIRKFEIAKRAFADTGEFDYLQFMLSDLLSKKQYNDFIQLFVSHKEIIQDGPFPYQGELYFGFVDCCCTLHDFETLDTHIWKKDAVHFSGRYSEHFILAISSFYQEKYLDAENSFKSAIVNDNEGNEVTRIATLFYIASLIKQGKNDLARSHIRDLKPREPYLDDYRVEAFSYESVIKSTVDALKTLDLNKNEKNVLAFYEASSMYDLEVRDVQTAGVIISLLEPLKDDYGGSSAYHYLMSEAYYILGSYDVAYEYKLRSIELVPKEEGVNFSVEISDTSEDFQQKIAHTLEEVYRFSRKRGFLGFVESEATYVIDFFWKEKKYYFLAELFDLIEERGLVDELSEYLFEFAYALKEAGSVGRARDYYEYSIQKNGESSAVLNNLALIQEQMGKIDQAKSLIEKAFQLTQGKDPIVLRNKERLEKENVKNTKEVGQKSVFEDEDEGLLLTYDADYGKLIFKDKSEKVRTSKLMPAVLEVLFRNPKPTYEALDIYAQLNLDELSNGRSLLDCIRAINKKTKKIGLKDEIFAFRSEKIFTDEKYLKRLHFKLTGVESK